MRLFALTLVTLLVSVLACGSDRPPPYHKLACDRLEACRISSSGFSCDDKRASACGECINGAGCGDILAGACAPPCPGVSVKAK
jgi:hypothetical protein